MLLGVQNVTNMNLTNVINFQCNVINEKYFQSVCLMASAEAILSRDFWQES